MVVKLFLAMMLQARRAAWPLPRASLLLAGMAVLPGQSGNISLLPPGLQLRAIEGLPNGSRLNEIAPLPYGDFASPIGSPDPGLSFASPWRAAGLPDVLGSDPVESQDSGPAAARFNDTVAANNEEFGVRGGPPAPITRAARGGVRSACDDNQLAVRLQAGGGYWTTQGTNATPVQFPPGVFTGNSLSIPNPLGDPTIGPSGDRSNLQPPGATGAWCPPVPVPFAQSSPLASRAFWTPFAVVLFGLLVFWLSRGVKLPSR